MTRTLHTLFISFFGILFAFILIGLGIDTHAATFTVTNTGDSGLGSLRQALLDAGAAGADTIDFAIPGAGPHTISPLSSLPSVPDNTTIDGFTQTSASEGNLQIVIDGSNLTGSVAGLNVSGNDSTLSGLSVVNFFDGSAGFGVYVSGDNTTLDGMYIGVGADGTTPGTNNAGLQIVGASNTIVGGTAKNVIAANNNDIFLLSGATGTQFFNNHLGTDYTATVPYKISSDIVAIIDSNDTIIGAATPTGFNVIGGARFDAIDVRGTSSGTTIINNYIGTDQQEIKRIGSTTGVRIKDTTSDTRVGGVNNLEANYIAYNTTNVRVEAGPTDTAVIGNSLYSANNQNSFDTEAFGVNFNDSPDVDGTPNVPIITTINDNDGTDFDVIGSLTSQANTDYAIHVYYNEFEINRNNLKVGKNYLGEILVTTDGTGVASFTSTFAKALLGELTTDQVTFIATATEYNTGLGEYLTTSEFGNNKGFNTGDIDERSDFDIDVTPSVRYVTEDEPFYIYLQASNTTGSTINNFLKTISLDSRLLPVSCSGCDIAGQNVTFQIGTFDTNLVFFASVKVVPQAGAAGRITIPVTASYDTNPSVINENRYVFFEAPRGSAVFESHSSGDFVSDGLELASGLSLEYKIKNNGSVPITNGQFSVTLDPAVSFLDCDGCVNVGQNVTFDIPTLPTGLEHGVVFRVTPNISDTEVSHQASFNSNEVSGVSPNDIFTFYSDTNNANIVVSNTNPSGAGSFDEALRLASIQPGVDSISFAIPGGGPHSLTHSQNSISSELIIDGSTQSGIIITDQLEVFGGRLSINDVTLQNTSTMLTIDSPGDNTITNNNFCTDSTGNVSAANQGTGLNLSNISGVSLNNTIEDNVFGGCTSGNTVEKTDFSTFIGNKYGVGRDETSDLPITQFSGITFTQSYGNTVGNAAKYNIFGNTVQGGLRFLDDSQGNTVMNNYVGITTNETTKTNQQRGIQLSGSANNTIGGDGLNGQGNVISGNIGPGVIIRNAPYSKVFGNRIGTNFLGDSEIPNTSAGVYIDYSDFVSIGSEQLGYGNLISGNDFEGVYSQFSDDLIIKGNVIGLNGDGDAKIPNSQGIDLVTNNRVIIGGATANERNILSGNEIQGLRVEDSTEITLNNNYIGLSSDGLTMLSNDNDGVYIDNTSLIDIDTNYISGNLNHGLFITGSTDLSFTGNRVGYNTNGDFYNGNDEKGLVLSNLDKGTIGGLTPGERNYFSEHRANIDFSGNDVEIIGNYFGTDFSGNLTTGAGSQDSIFYSGQGTGNIIGGNTANHRNVFGNADSMIDSLSGYNLTIQGNYFGLNADGSNAPDLTGESGIVLQTFAQGWTIGGENPGEGNMFANTRQGVVFVNTSGNVDPSTYQMSYVQGNTFGFDAAGNDMAFGGVPSGTLPYTGSAIYSGRPVQIGGDTLGKRNVIANYYDGVKLRTFSGNNNLGDTWVKGNIIGLDAAGVVAKTIGQDGIEIDDVQGVEIGGLLPGERNIIGNAVNNNISIYNVPDTVTILNNYIGTDINGTADHGAASYGVYALDSNSIQVGDGTAQGRNVISGNDEFGIYIENNTANVPIRGNYIGLDYTGEVALGNDSGGIYVDSDGPIQVGGPLVGDRNIISGNDGGGIFLYALNTGQNNSQVINNFIGTDKDGEVNLGAGTIGIDTYILIDGVISDNIISGAGQNAIWDYENTNLLVNNNSIGTDITGTIAFPNGTEGAGDFPTILISNGSTQSEYRDNLVSGNSFTGFNIRNSNQTELYGNIIGLASDNSPLGNGSYGIVPFASNFTIIGSNTPGEGNIIGNNGEGGIYLLSNSDSNAIVGNMIGTDTLGADHGNDGPGITLDSNSTDNWIGGATASDGNIITNNTGKGIEIYQNDSNLNAILSNSIYNNGGIGIDLVGGTENTAGITANDTGDTDTGANDLQNFPVFSSVTQVANDIQIVGSAEVENDSDVIIQFYASDSYNPLSNREAQYLIHTINGTTTGGVLNFNETIPTSNIPNFTTFADYTFSAIITTVGPEGQGPVFGISLFLNGTLGNSSEIGLFQAPVIDSLVIDKVNDAPNGEIPGEEVVFTINYENDGTEDYTNVSIQDTFGDYEFVSCSNNCAFVADAGGDYYEWTIPTLNSGDTGSVTITLRIPSNYTQDTITNEVEIIHANSTDQDTDIVDVLYPSAIVDVSAAPSNVTAGEQITKTITYENNGESDLNNVIITDVLDGDLSFVSCTGGCGTGGQTVTWNVGTVLQGASGSFDLVFYVDINSTQTSIVNTVELTADEISPVNDDVTLSITPAAAAATFTSTPSDTEVERGDVVTYTLDYENTGNIDITNSTISTTLDSELVYISCTGGCNEINGVLTWTIGTVTTGQNGSVTFQVEVFDQTNVNTINNTATFDGDQISPLDANTTLNVTIPQSAGNVLVTAVDDTLAYGDTGVFVVDYENTGGTQLTNAVLTVTINDNFEYVPGSCSGGCDETDPTALTWSLGTLAIGQSGQVEFEAIVLDNSTLQTNELTVFDFTTDIIAILDADEISPVESDDEVTIIIPSITVDKLAARQVMIEGETNTYTITVANNGQVPVMDITVGDSLDDVWEFVSCNNNCVVGGQEVTWEITELEPSEFAVLTVDVRASNPQDSVDNEAVASSGNLVVSDSYNGLRVNPRPALPRTGGELIKNYLMYTLLGFITILGIGTFFISRKNISRV